MHGIAFRGMAFRWIYAILCVGICTHAKAYARRLVTPKRNGKFKKYIVFESFQKLFWEGACDDLKCTEISDRINERIENKTLQNFCTDCGIDMGDCNPRQLCGKRMCMDENYVF